MKQRLLRSLLWDKKLTPHQETVWALLIVLAPLALAAGMHLQFRIARAIPLEIKTTREYVLERTHQFAERYGFNTQNWEERARAHTEMEIYRYLYGQGPAGREVLRNTGAWSTITTRLSDSEDEHGVELDIAPSGEVTGYRVRPRVADTSVIPDQEARAIADKAMAARLAQRPSWKFDAPAVANGPNNTRIYQWSVRIPELPGLDGKTTLRLRGRQVVEDRLSFELNGDGRRGLPGRSGRETHTALFGGAAALGFSYLVVRYVRRRWQKEVSRERMHLVAFICGLAAYAVVVLLDALPRPPSGELPMPHWAFLTIVALICYAGGLILGLSYAAAESDLREPYGDQLVSLDAWLSGKVFSRNVGRSVVLGTVLFSWMLLLRNVAYLTGGARFPGLDVLDGAYDHITAELPFFSVLAASLSSAILMVITSTLVPLAFVTRQIKRRWLQLGVFVFLGCLALSFFTAEPLPWYSWTVVTLLQAGTLVLAFLLVDLLTAVVVAAVFCLVTYFVAMGQIAPGFQRDLEPAVALSVLMLLAAIASTIWGRFVRGDEVRPAYARDIQERLQLQSEVQAAKEAQQRLLPVSAPEMPGVSIVATCHSAEQVSGDFYDFFPIGKDRLGILLTDGGGNGLATALSIALTKGYLMHKAQAGLSPVRTLVGLLATLGEELHAVNAEGLCYAVLDTSEGVLRFARMGETPGLLVVGAPDALQESRFGDVGSSLWEGRIQLVPGMKLLLYTNGVSRAIGEPDRTATNRWLVRKAGSVFAQPPGELLEWLVNLVLGKRGGRRGRTIHDDVTLMVVAVDRNAAFGVDQEQVA